MTDVLNSGRVVGGFGSAGAGNRSGRLTMNRGGLSTSYAESLRRKPRPTSVVTRADPTKEQLEAYIAANSCWWCDSPVGHNGKPFKHLGGHWKRAHGIDLQWVRDLLGVSKHTSFISDESKAKLSTLAKAKYDPNQLKPKPGCTREYSLYGRSVQQQKSFANAVATSDRLKGLSFEERSRRSKLAIQTLGPEAAAERARAMSRSTGDKRRKVTICSVCQSVFRRADIGASHTRKTCSKECEVVHRSRSAYRQGMTDAPCSVCGTIYSTAVATSRHKKTCSKACAIEAIRRWHLGRRLSSATKATLSNQAKARWSDESANRLKESRDLENSKQWTLLHKFEAGSRWTRDRVVDALGINPNHASTLLSTLARLGKLVRISRGVYSLP